MTRKDRKHVLGLCARPEGYDCKSQQYKTTVNRLAKEGLIAINQKKAWHLTAAGSAAHHQEQLP